MATRYHHIRSFMYKHFTPLQNRLLVMKIFDNIDMIKDSVIQKCRNKRASNPHYYFFSLKPLLEMEKTNIFNEEVNSERMMGFFRKEFSKGYVAQILKILLIF